MSLKIARRAMARWILIQIHHVPMQDVIEKTGCHYSWHSANRDEIDILAKRHIHPTLILRSLRVRAKWRNDQMPKKPRTSDITDQPLAVHSEPHDLSSQFVLDTDDPSFVTCKCQWLLGLTFLFRYTYVVHTFIECCTITVTM